MRAVAVLAILLFLATSTAAALVSPYQGPFARYAAGTLTIDASPNTGCSDLIGPAAGSYGESAPGQWDLRLDSIVIEPGTECILPVLWLNEIFAFRTDVSLTGGVSERWISSACGWVAYVVEPFPTPGAFRMTADFYPPAGCTQQRQVHIEWALVIS